MKLSLCIATFNEEKFIHYPLNSCIDWVDEVIVVDGGSTDRTVEIATSYGKKVHVYHEENPPMFHINKQKAIEHAKGDWILQLDADEQVTPELKTEIMNTINTSSKAVAYWLSRKNYFLGRFLTKGGVYPDRTIRLYRRGVARFPCKNVHENVEIQGTVDYLTHDLLHYADPHFSRYLKRWKRYNNLDVTLLKNSNTKVGGFNYVVWKPISTFFSMYGRHKGFMDGWQGLVFAFFSSIRYIDIYQKAKISGLSGD